MNIGIIGAGNVGTVLGKGLAMAGHRVLMSSRDPQNAKHRFWKQEVGGNGDMASFDEAARFGEIVILALPWSCLKDVLDTIGPVRLSNKTVIDVSNAVRFDNGPRLQYDHTSAGEWVQSWLPESHIVKALNTVSDKRMVQPYFKEGIPAMFISGNADHAKQQVKTILGDLGWSDIIDLGDIRQSRLQEAVMLACVISEIRLQLPGAAFALLKQ
ncbi:NADPH-dependent F420 reductase [Paenibacillus hemerocallicola]|uniref:NADPH-dependent F420 reductase n=1 Tax=Paenibacillus hemerocallicola TaxID=1172614 RepID=UPI00159EF4C6|nr:NAD(P)-binding domain-containing protein [Paenibacillus hemerocallicola]